MNPWRRSLTYRMVALILVGAGLVLLLVEGFSYSEQRHRVIGGAIEHGEMLTEALVRQIESSFGRAEAVVQQNALFLSEGKIERKETVDLIRRTLEAHPSLFGMAVALSKEEAAESDFDILYGWQNGDAIAVDNRPSPEDDYRHDWFRLPAERQVPVWIEPYYDTQADTAMVTYSVPVVRDGKTIAVVTCDLSLGGIQTLLDTLPLDESSFAVLLSERGTFISHPQDELEMVASVSSLADAQEDPESAETLRELGRRLLSGTPGWLRYRRPFTKEWAYIFYAGVPSTGWALGVVREEAEVLAPLVQLNRLSGMLGVAGLALLLAPAIAIAWSVVTPVRRLAEAAHRLAAGDFDAPLPPVRSDDEVGRLTRAFDRMRSELRQYIADLTATTAAKEKIASELAIARAIQLGIVPKLFPPFPNRNDIDLYAVLDPAREVGGDLYDFGLLDDDHLYVAIGDVSGKGVPASLLMAVGKTLLKSTLFSLRDPALALGQVNAELSEDNDACMFITLFCAMIHLKTGDMIYSSAGHNPPLLARSSGTIEWLKPLPCPPVGICPDMTYHNYSERLFPGDLLLLYTDGVTEAMNPSDVLFGDERLLDFAQQHRQAGAADLVRMLCEAVHSHAAGAEQSDDITALAVRFLSGSNASAPGTSEAEQPAETSPASSLVLQNRIDELPRLATWLDELGASRALPSEATRDLHLALEEWLTNVISYAYSDEKEHAIRLRLWHMPGQLRIEIADDGEPFDPTARREPDTTLPLEHRPIGGLGIHFVRKTMDGFSYRREDGHNIVTLTKHLGASDQPAESS